MKDVLYYTYEADEHCVDCAVKRFEAKDKDHASFNPSDTDENYIPYNAKDREGNVISAVLRTEETPADLPAEAGGRDVVCGDCGVLIKKQAPHA